ncbi:hypothetical protein [Psychrobacter ciconiae]|uniref:hypothetical protein n=1 Tax=Psychrobacter ciconiae TaxID=1553449 RepID=UPI001917E938|nr:hypothetical protein [Psychrobacter ciconiae]
MQIKHVIIASLVAIVVLAAFNIVSNQRHDSQRTAMLSETAQSDAPTVAQNDTSLGQQPKAILDDANHKIDVATAQNEQQLAAADQE